MDGCEAPRGGGGRARDRVACCLRGATRTAGVPQPGAGVRARHGVPHQQALHQERAAHAHHPSQALHLPDAARAGAHTLHRSVPQVRGAALPATGRAATGTDGSGGCRLGLADQQGVAGEGWQAAMKKARRPMRSLAPLQAHVHALARRPRRDIKPQNLLVNINTHALKLCDFGSAKTLVRCGEAGLSGRQPAAGRQAPPVAQCHAPASAIRRVGKGGCSQMLGCPGAAGQPRHPPPAQRSTLPPPSNASRRPLPPAVWRRGEPNISYICSRYYRAPELIFGATDYTCAIDVRRVNIGLLGVCVWEGGLRACMLPAVLAALWPPQLLQRLGERARRHPWPLPPPRRPACGCGARAPRPTLRLAANRVRRCGAWGA